MSSTSPLLRLSASGPALPEHCAITEIHRTARTLVLRAQRRADQRPVVLKTIAPTCHDPTARRRLADELDTLSLLADGGVVRAHRWLDTPYGPLLELEDLGADTLLNVDASVSRVVDIGISLMTTLAAVHRAGVLHLDVSPANISYEPTTGRVTLLDFGAARRVVGRSTRPSADGGLGGTMGYWAPEQTGRLALSVDRRTDLFSVGAVLYRLLTGVAPGPTDDMLRAVHAALALVPATPASLRPAVPDTLSRIVMKLLAKVSDDRYHGAPGVLHDLQRVRAALTALGEVEPFELAMADVPEVFTPSRRLYGREVALETLGRAWTHATTIAADTAIAIVGPSGVGKSALVAEAARRFGMELAPGKADHAGSRPLGVLLEALTAAIRARLGLPEEDLARIRSRAREAVSDAGPAVLEVVPGLQALTGDLAPVTALPPAESLNRTAAALEALLLALHDEAAPLVLFLDDLQWADQPSLQIVERLLLRPAPRPTLILSWRDSEVDAGGPSLIAAMVSRLPAGTFVHLRVEPLTLADVTDFVRDSLHCSAARAGELAGMLTEKSAGNPYFVFQLLDTLHERGLLTLDPAANTWTWDAAAVAALEIAPNVAELLAERLSTFSKETKDLLSLAARLGHHVPLRTLAVAAGLGLGQVTDALGPALEAGHLFEHFEEKSISFAHSRVQRAARDLRTVDERGADAVDIARRLLEAGDEVDVFVVADACLEACLGNRSGPGHQNRLPEALGAVDTQGSEGYAQAFTRAARAARMAGASTRALHYAEAAAVVLLQGGDAWTHDRSLMMQAYLEGAQASVTALDRPPQPDFIGALLAQETDPLLRASIHGLKLDRHLARWENGPALDTALAALRELGVRVPRHPGAVTAARALATTAWRLWRVGDAGVEALPVATDPRVTAAQNMLLRAVTAAYYSEPPLLSVLILRCIDLTLSGGVGPCSPWALASYAFLQAVFLGRLERAVVFAALARSVDKRVDGRFFRARLELNLAGFVESRTGRLDAVPEVYSALSREALAQGDWEYAVVCANNFVLFGLSSGRSLIELAERGDEVIATCKRVGHRRWTMNARFYAQIVACLRGGADGPADPGALSGAFIGVEEMEAESASVGTGGRDEAGLAACLCARTFVRVHLGEYERALESADATEAHLGALPGAPQLCWHHVLASVARAWCARTAVGARRRSLLRAAHRGRRAMGRWAKASPHNHGHQCVLLDGALHAAEGRLAEASTALEEAARLGLAEGFVQDAALAMRLAADVAAARGHEHAAASYLAEAQALYQRWGANAAADRLGAGTPSLAGPTGAAGPTSAGSVSVETGAAAVVATDHLALLRAAQAIAVETSVDALLERLLTVLMEAVGARRGLLAMPRGGALRAVATGEANGSRLQVQVFGIAQSVTVESTLPASAATLAFVARTGERVLLTDARRGGGVTGVPGGGGDARSVMATPIRKGDLVLAVVYLDNEILPGAFTAAHDEFVSVLASQAAVALENALLVDDLRTAAETQRRLAESYGRFVPHQFLDQIRRRSILDVVAGDQVVRDFTVLFADVRGFTAIAERLEAARTFAFINEYLRYVQPAIDAHGGFINQFLGDGIVALFGESPDSAVAGTLAVLRGVQKYNLERDPQFPEIRVGAGLNTGSLVLGVLGGRDRMDCGVIGDAVNLAARVEGMTKSYGATLLISGTTVSGLASADRWSLREIDLVVPVGRVQPIEIHEVLDAESDSQRQGKVASREVFDAARAAYTAGRFDEARRGFARCLAMCPDDGAAEVLAARCERFQREGEPDGWDGAYRLTVK